MGDEREFEAAAFASVPFFVHDDLSGTTLGAEDVFPENDAPNVFLDLRFGGYLF